MTSIPDPIATLVAIRAAHHSEAAPQYDRVVFEFSGPIPLLKVEYVHQLIEDGSGAPVVIKGGAVLMVQLTPARAHDDQAQSTAPGRMAVSMPNVKEIVRAGDFEANLTYGIGLTQKVYIRILTLASPSRVVIDLLRP